MKNTFSKIISSYHEIAIGNSDELLRLYDKNKLLLSQSNFFDNNIDKLIEIRCNIVTCLYDKGRFSETIAEGIKNSILIDENNLSSSTIGIVKLY